MAGLVIRGMELPESCGKCDLICKAFSKWEGAEWTDKRHPDCPLLPLPEGHGRLGDLDALVWSVRKNEFMPTTEKNTIIHLLRSARTIVPAEGSARNE